MQKKQYLAVLQTNGSGVLSFATPSSGKILQVVSASDFTERSSSSTSYVTASNTLSLSITPSSASNKVLIIANFQAYNDLGTAVTWYTIYRNSTNLGTATGMGAYQGSNIYDTSNFTLTSYDSPATTSAITYQVYFKVDAGTGYLGNRTPKQTITAFEIAG